MKTNIKVVNIENPQVNITNSFKFSDMKKLGEYKRKLDDIISQEFNEFYNNPIRRNNYDWTKVARTSYLNVCPRGIRNKEFIFEIFEMNDINKGDIMTHYNKGKVLEQMIIKINWI